MPKVIVRDIIESHRQLTRLQRYAERYMDDVPIEQANDSIVEARDLLSENLRNFEALDITTLTPDMSDIRRKLSQSYNEIGWLGDEISDYKDDILEMKNDGLSKRERKDSWQAKEIKRCKREIESYRENIGHLEAELNED